MQKIRVRTLVLARDDGLLARVPEALDERYRAALIRDVSSPPPALKSSRTASVPLTVARVLLITELSSIVYLEVTDGTQPSPGEVVVERRSEVFTRAPFMCLITRGYRLAISSQSGYSSSEGS